MIEESLYSYYFLGAALPGARSYRGPDVTWVCTSLPHYIFNRVFQADLSLATEKRIGEVLRNFPAETPVLWFVGPRTRPADLGERLRPYGFNHLGDMNIMAVPLSELPFQSSPSGLHIERITKKEQLPGYLEVFQVFGLPSFAGQYKKELFADLALNRGWPWYRFLGTFEERPATIVDIYLHKGIVCLFSVATIPDFRGRGFATAILLWALSFAAEQGADYAVLEAIAEEEPTLYLKLLFRTCMQMRCFVRT